MPNLNPILPASITTVNLNNIFNTVWNHTYQADGVHFGQTQLNIDPENPESPENSVKYRHWVMINGIEYDEDTDEDKLIYQQAKNHSNDPLTQATAFLGLPNRMLDLNQEQ